MSSTCYFIDCSNETENDFARCSEHIVRGVADCGHEYTATGIDGGYATRMDGATLCYSCADADQRATAAVSDTIYGYISSDARYLQTWTGGVLGKVLTYNSSRTGWHDSEVWHWRVVTPNGRKFYGRNSGPGMNIRMTAVKADRKGK